MLLFLEQHAPEAVVDLSVVVPVYNEIDNLPELTSRILKVMEDLGRSYEVIFVDDGSSDGSTRYLRDKAQEHEKIVFVELQRNVGQHPAVFAGLEFARGEVVVTLDADLQNPPEQIPRLLEALDEGHDVAAGWRSYRRDSILRRAPSWVVNKLVSMTTGVQLHDYGCMLRAYRREVVDCMRQCPERSSFIPALANLFARSVVEVPVEHAERGSGQSKYNLFKLLSLNFDLMTGFSLLPIKWVSAVGLVVAMFGLAFGLMLLVRRLLLGPEAEGVFTLMAILFIFTGLQLLAVGMVGEYVARSYNETQGRPRYVVRAVHGVQEVAPASTTGAPAHGMPTGVVLSTRGRSTDAGSGTGDA